jgi:hypothetical protein
VLPSGQRVAPVASFVIVLALAVTVASNAFAEGTPDAALSAPAAPASAAQRLLIADLGQHVVAFGYQASTSRWIAAQIVGGYYQPWTQNINFLGLSGDANKGGDLRGVIARGRVFVHPFGAAPTGLWISPFVQAGIGWGLRGDDRRAGPVSAAGVSVGYSALLGESILLGGGLGLQYHEARIPGGDGAPRFSRYYPQVDIQLGYAL